MINVLIVDDEVMVQNIMKDFVEYYFTKNNVEEYQIDIASNGLEVLDAIRINNKDKYQPYICMVTSMNSENDIKIYKERKALSYILKPCKITSVVFILDRYILPLIQSVITINKSDEFIDFFEIDESFQNENIFSQEEQHDIELSNETLKPISAVEFLKEYSNIDYMLDELDEIEELLHELICHLDISSYKIHIHNLNSVFNLYITFLSSLACFEQFTLSLSYIKDILLELNILSIKVNSQIFIIKMIVTTLKDIHDWKHNVFVEKSVIDVFYINASIYNNCIQLKNLIVNGKV